MAESDATEKIGQSAEVGGAAFALLLATCCLGICIRCSKPKSGKKDIFGYKKGVAETASQTPQSWSPAGFCQKKFDPCKGSVLYTGMWVFLGLWLTVSSLVLLILAGIEDLVIYREEEMATAIIAVTAAIILCALWLVVFRAVWKWAKVVAFFMLFVAWCFATYAVTLFQPLTYPGVVVPITVGVCFGTLAGWLLVAVSLSHGIAVSVYSYPEGKPECYVEYTDIELSTLTSGALFNNTRPYMASLTPLLWAFIGFVIASTSSDPFHCAPMLVLMLFFTRRCCVNWVCAGLAALGIVFGSWSLYAVRN